MSSGSVALTDLVKLYERMFELSPDGFVFVDGNGDIININPTYCEQLNITRQSAVGKPVIDIIKNSVLHERIRNNSDLEERNVFWQVVPGQYSREEKYVIVSRCTVKDEYSRTIGAVGQVKFINETMKLADTLRELSDELNYYKEELNRIGGNKYSFDNILGSSPAIEAVKEIARRASRNDFTVLLSGETGTGKEVFANAIHYASARKNKPIIRVNCAAIPHDLFESEFFGYAEGAFTGAKKGGKRGTIELANGGTLFLDEIGDMPPFMQVKLLRVLQEKEIKRVGGESAIPVDVRVIAASNRNLSDEINAGRFRADLYYRLNVISMLMPPLRKRREDILVFSESFLDHINRQYKTAVRLSPEAEKVLLNYQWPGNVRELRNTIERAYTLASDGVILDRHLPPHIISKCRLQSVDMEKSLDDIMSGLEREIILEAVLKNGGNLRKTADNLGIHRSTLYKKMDTCGLCRKDFVKNESAAVRGAEK